MLTGLTPRQPGSLSIKKLKHLELEGNISGEIVRCAWALYVNEMLQLIFLYILNKYAYLLFMKMA